MGRFKDLHPLPLQSDSIGRIEQSSTPVNSLQDINFIKQRIATQQEFRNKQILKPGNLFSLIKVEKTLVLTGATAVLHLNHEYVYKDKNTEIKVTNPRIQFERGKESCSMSKYIWEAHENWGEDQNDSQNFTILIPVFGNEAESPPDKALLISIPKKLYFEINNALAQDDRYN